MKVSPVGAQAAAPQVSQSAQDSRARAIAMLQGPQAAQVQETPPEVAHAQAASNQSEAQQSTNEAPIQQAEDAKPSEEEAKLSTQYAVLARKEKQLRAKAQAQEQALKQREQALLAKEESLKSQESKYSNGYIDRNRLRSDLLNVLAEEGISYDEITNSILQQPKADPQTMAVIKSLENQVKTLMQSQEEAKKLAEQSQTQAYKQAVQEIRRDAQSLVNQDPAFEATKAMGATNEIVKLIERTFNEDGVLMTVEEAARAVEEEALSRLSKWSRVSKVQKRLQTPASPSQAPTKQSGAVKQTQQMKTLTNSATSTGKLSARDRALLAFKGELNRK